MKRTIPVTILAFILAFCLTACGCKHEWKEATCTNPKTCALCGKTEGEVKAHQWQDATCTAPRTCKDCGLTEGAPAGHSWKDATCAAPKTCEICKKTEGDSLEHTLGEIEIADPSYSTATCTYVQKCTVCGQEFAEKGTLVSLHDGENFCMSAQSFADRLQDMLQDMQDLINDNEYLTLIDEEVTMGNLQMLVGSMDPAGNVTVPGIFEFSSHDAMLQAGEQWDGAFYSVVGEVSGAEHAALTLISIVRTADPTLDFKAAQQYTAQLLQNRTLELNGISYGVMGNDQKMTIIVAVSGEPKSPEQVLYTEWTADVVAFNTTKKDTSTIMDYAPQNAEHLHVQFRIRRGAEEDAVTIRLACTWQDGTTSEPTKTYSIKNGHDFNIPWNDWNTYPGTIKLDIIRDDTDQVIGTFSFEVK